MFKKFVSEKQSNPNRAYFIKFIQNPRNQFEILDDAISDSPMFAHPGAVTPLEGDTNSNHALTSRLPKVRKKKKKK